MTHNDYLSGLSLAAEVGDAFGELRHVGLEGRGAETGVGGGEVGFDYCPGIGEGLGEE